MIQKTFKTRISHSRPYPGNLLDDIFENNLYHVDSDGNRRFLNPGVTPTVFPADVGGVVEYLLTTELTPNERDVIVSRYVDRMTLADIGRGKGWTSERARQVEAKALMKLRRPRCLSLLTNGLDGYIQTRVDGALAQHEATAYDKGYRDGAVGTRPDSDVVLQTLSTLNLSNRSYNALMRAGYRYVGDLANVDLRSIRQIGKQSVKEIRIKLDELGVPYLYS